jgi:putative tryptophan/tyrosine transport system substrate-binding protein
MLTKTQAGLAISDDDLFTSNSSRLAALATLHAVPAIAADRGFATAGGLMSYGANLTEIYHQTGVYAGMVLRGRKTAELPVYQINKARFIVNRRCARSFSLTLPPALLARADEIIG